LRFGVRVIGVPVPVPVPVPEKETPPPDVAAAVVEVDDDDVRGVAEPNMSDVGRTGETMAAAALATITPPRAPVPVKSNSCMPTLDDGPASDDDVIVVVIDDIVEDELGVHFALLQPASAYTAYEEDTSSIGDGDSDGDVRDIGDGASLPSVADAAARDKDDDDDDNDDDDDDDDRDEKESGLIAGDLLCCRAACMSVTTFFTLRRRGAGTG
jgi:hypothetical protein